MILFHLVVVLNYVIILSSCFVLIFLVMEQTQLCNPDIVVNCRYSSSVDLYFGIQSPSLNAIIVLVLQLLQQCTTLYLTFRLSM